MDERWRGWSFQRPSHRFRRNAQSVGTGRPLCSKQSPGIGHNQGPPLGEPPAIPPNASRYNQSAQQISPQSCRLLAGGNREKQRRQDISGSYREFTGSLRASLTFAPIFRLPKTLKELQQDVLNPQVGYDIHHVVEQTPARDEGFPEDIIDGPENLVRIPTLKHWQINGWYSRRNDLYGGLSPRRLSERQDLGSAHACR